MISAQAHNGPISRRHASQRSNHATRNSKRRGMSTAELEKGFSLSYERGFSPDAHRHLESNAIYIIIVI